MKNTEDALLDAEVTDIVDLMRNGGAVSHDFVPEQELYFDAGVQPTRGTWKLCKEEWIDGKLYKVFS